jgi:hypothetical protein
MQIERKGKERKRKPILCSLGVKMPDAASLKECPIPGWIGRQQLVRRVVAII